MLKNGRLKLYNILSAEKISKSFGTKELFSDLTFGIAEGDKIGLIGVNGTGKSTLLKILVGQEKPDHGQITTINNIRIGYLPQNPVFNEKHTILEEVIKGNTPAMQIVRLYEDTLRKIDKFPNDSNHQKKLLQITQQMDEAQAWQLESQAKTILTKLGITDFDLVIGELSGGQRKRVALASALINPVDLLILDEPTNHIDNQTVDWLEQFLKQRPGALLMITHDRYFLDRVTDRIFELDQGNIYSYSGNYSLYLEKKAEREELEQSAAAKRENLYRRELSWIRRGAKARSTKQQARIDRFEKLQAQMSDFIEDRSVEMMSYAASRLGKKVIILEQLEKNFGSQKIIIDFNYIISRHDRIGIVGPNGVGKSTLLNLITGKIQPDKGKIEIGPTVKFGYFTQEHLELDEKSRSQLRVIEYIREIAEFLPTADGGMISASQMLERFLFSPSVQWTPVINLSGGEKRRLFLLKILMGAPNVLILDEPTNDLDIKTLSILEEYLEGFPGVVITVSHDRYFLDRIVDKIIVFKGSGLISTFEGDYSNYLEEQVDPDDDTSSPTDKEVNKKQPSKFKKESTSFKTRPAKLSYKEQREYEGIETVIFEVETELKQVKEEIEKAGSDYQSLQKLTQTEQQLEQRLEILLERWAFLSELVLDFEKEK